MGISITLFGVFLLILGWVYLYKLKVVFKINQFFTSNFFSDTVVLSEHRKIGLFFILLAIIALYTGFSKINIEGEARANISAESRQ